MARRRALAQSHITRCGGSARLRLRPKERHRPVPPVHCFYLHIFDLCYRGLDSRFKVLLLLW